VKSGRNWYSYAGQNPLRYLDANGENPLIIVIVGLVAAYFLYKTGQWAYNTVKSMFMHISNVQKLRQIEAVQAADDDFDSNAYQETRQTQSHEVTKAGADAMALGIKATYDSPNITASGSTVVSVGDDIELVNEGLETSEPIENVLESAKESNGIEVGDGNEGQGGNSGGGDIKGHVP